MLLYHRHDQMTIKKTSNPNERIRNGVLEKQLGPHWVPAPLVKMFRMKCVSEDADQQDVMQMIVIAYLEDRILPKAK